MDNTEILDKMSIKELVHELGRCAPISNQYPIYAELLTNKIIEKRHQEIDRFILEFSKNNNIDIEILKKFSLELNRC